MGTIFLILLFLSITTYETTAQNHRDCSRAEYTRCVSLADPLLKEPHLVFPDNMRDIELVCLSWNQFVDCLRGYTDRCFTDSQRVQFNKAVEMPIESIHQMCTQRSYQQEYLQHATCIKSTVTQPQHCGDQYSQLVNQVSQGDAISRASLCCSHDKFRRCVTREARRLCDGGIQNGQAVRFAKQIIDKALSFLQDQCFNYIPSASDCLTAIYKTDDQLALSTSPWYSTRSGSPSYSSSDLDVLSTGVTFQENSDTSGVRQSSPSLHQPVPPLLHQPSSGVHQSSPGVQQSPPVLQPVDTRVTDVSWLPTDGGSSSTGFKDGSTGTMSDNGRNDAGYNTVLGSRTRPSSYGRSSSWESSVSPAVTPPTRPDWATTTTWRVSDTSGGRTSHNYSPYPGTTNNDDEKFRSTFDRRTTTEAWYPIAGSHAGNEVDEPNQLGLSKPENIATRNLIALPVLLISLLLLSIYC